MKVQAISLRESWGSTLLPTFHGPWAMGIGCWHPGTHNATMVVAAVLHFVVKVVEKIQDHFGLAAIAVIQQAVGECRTYARDDVRTLVMNAYPEYFRDF